MMLAVLLAAATAASSLDLRGVFPPEIKTVGVVMPASILGKAKFDRGVSALQKAGYKVKLAPRLSFKKLASVEDRVKDFEETWMDPEVDLVLCARGGTGAEGVIVQLDWEKLRKRPNQRVLGFSNITMILNAMLKERAGHPFSGPSISQICYAQGDTFEWLSRAIAGKPQPAAKLCALKPGAFSGYPCGGHISLVRKGIAMKWNADARGRVVFLERNGSTTVEGIRKELDDILTSGYLAGAVGVIFGDVTPKEKNEAARARVEELKRDFAARAGCPVYDGYAYGHIPVSHTIDFFRRVSVAEDGTMTWEDVLVPIASLPVACREVTTVADRAPSLLPEGKEFRLVWNDEFDGTALDESKWSYRTNFWGRDAHWFAKPEHGCVEVKDGVVRLKVRKLENGQFVSPQLQTGELIWDVPAVPNAKSFWYVGKQSKPKFVHKYGYYECRCRLQRKPGWWSAFWMQTMMQGCCLDPGLAGIEQDIMESFDPGEVIVSSFHTNGYGPDYMGFHIPKEYDEAPTFDGKLNLAVDTEEFHTFGLLWEPDGYSVYVDGRLKGRNAAAVSHVPEFLLISTECKWYRQNRMTGKGVPELEAAAAENDDFVVDYVRVYDIVKM